MTALLCTISFIVGMGFRQWLTSIDRPRVTPWGESTELWSEVDWMWFKNQGGGDARRD